MNKIICNDVLNGFDQIKDETVHLIVTSPPFNVRLNYEDYSSSCPGKEFSAFYNDNLSHVESYMDEQCLVSMQTSPCSWRKIMCQC